MALQLPASKMGDDLEKFALPSTKRLQQTEIVSTTISKLIAIDEEESAYHRQMIRDGICNRYEFAIALSADPKAFAAYLREDRVKALKRRPKSVANVLASLFQASYRDPKKASKYFKRIEHLWVKRRPVNEVMSFLKKHGLSKVIQKAAKGQPPPRAGRREAEDRHRACRINKDDPPGGSILGWPTTAKVGRTYDVTIRITECKGEAAIFELLAMPRLSS